ncbi:MAG: AprI/Inh family metalloprotease inhibitor [Devosiaceae bacterium]
MAIQARTGIFAAKRTTSIAVLASAFAMSACMGGGGNQLRPLTPVPTTSVTATSLPQPITTSQDTAFESQTLDEAAGINQGLDPLDPNAPFDSSVQSAALDGAPLPSSTQGGSEVSEDELIGAWSAATPSATCAINLSLTTWQGGYRASTRNCGDVQMAGLTAWSVEGQQVFLKGADGATLARLFRTGPTRYAGQLETGGAVTVFR